MTTSTAGLSTHSLKLLLNGDAFVIPNLMFQGNGLTAIVGPNGIGKSTLLSALAGASHRYTGEVCLDNQPLAVYAASELKYRRAVLLQNEQLHFPFTVWQVIEMSGYAIHMPAIQALIATFELDALLGRAFTQLSGGEKQRVHLVRCIAQVALSDHQSRYLLLDEPFNHLDLHFQYALFEKLHELSQIMNVVVVMHDLRRVIQHIPNTVLLAKNGVMQGNTSDILCEPNLQASFSVSQSML